jgi:hypothetical protein
MTPDPKADALAAADALMAVFGYRRVEPIPAGDATEIVPELVELMDEMAEFGGNYGGSSSED